MDEDVSSPASSHEAPPSPARRFPWRGWLCLVGLVAGGVFIAGSLWREKARPEVTTPVSSPTQNVEIRKTAQAVDHAFAEAWAAAGLEPAPLADDLTIARRLSLALTGTIPSLEEIRALESQPGEERLDWWLTRLLDDPRSSDYVAERLARAFVGTENGPFLVYRRRRMVQWLSEQLASRRPYDEIVRKMIAAEGLWTTNPAANFITVTIDQNQKKEGPDQVQLAIRTTRAFLGVRIDCVQCHDDKFGDRWKQEDFHQLAAFFAGAEMKLTGVRDNRHRTHEVRFRGDEEESTVLPVVPFSPELMPEQGQPRERLAAWVTHPKNRPFAREAVNRTWALLFGRPLVGSIDDVPLDSAELPPGLELLAQDFIDHGFDFQRLIRTVATTTPFQLASQSADPAKAVTSAHEDAWAAFPLTRLRPEQVAGSVAQAAYLDTIDEDAPFLVRLTKFGQQNDFVKRYGDLGENEFADQTGTIPQRLLLMNGKMVRERTDNKPGINGVTRVSQLAPDAKTAVETAYLCVFTRRPSAPEAEHFENQLAEAKGTDRQRALQDLYWSLFNATEFSWNH
ncbi:MAG: DUF1549 domain-containing protein [Verrucomicrobiae bacterium]|nr:DUF1549 domain-containing protein [Verrucomicrobiae bacterium]